ncbi:TetR/AcrR family transcriptional regulator [Mycolicibacterium goodii]|uniref:TetR/AcrR family transcriptional regulator n=1 Tax=Mycolicibacterium goodii TaxID=134601 RepID=UPI0006730DC1
MTLRGAPAGERAERADSRRKRLRLIAAARSAIAEHGLDVSATDIAGQAEVGVGTLYRRFGSKEGLIEAVLVDIIAAIAQTAREALTCEDPAAGLETVLTVLVREQAQNRGLSDFVAGEAASHSADFRRHTETLRQAIEELTRRAQAAGAIRTDVTWRDIAALAQSAAPSSACLGVSNGGEQWRRNLTVLLDGLRPPGVRAMPGTPPHDVESSRTDQQAP